MIYIVSVLAGIFFVAYILERKENRFLKKNVAQYLFFVETCARFKNEEKWAAHRGFKRFIGVEAISGNIK